VPHIQPTQTIAKRQNQLSSQAHAKLIKLKFSSNVRATITAHSLSNCSSGFDTAATSNGSQYVFIGRNLSTLAC